MQGKSWHYSVVGDTHTHTHILQDATKRLCEAFAKNLAVAALLQLLHALLQCEAIAKTPRSLSLSLPLPLPLSLVIYVMCVSICMYIHCTLSLSLALSLVLAPLSC
jgi:hypothetical protein